MNLNQALISLRQAVEGIITTTNTVSASFTLNNGDAVNTTVTTTNPAGSKIEGVADFTYYIDAVVSGNEIPYGSSLDMSQWQYIPPYNDWGKTNNFNLKTVAYLRNISAGTHTIFVRATVRTITNSLTNASQTGS